MTTPSDRIKQAISELDFENCDDHETFAALLCTLNATVHRVSSELAKSKHTHDAMCILSWWERLYSGLSNAADRIVAQGDSTTWQKAAE